MTPTQISKSARIVDSFGILSCLTFSNFDQPTHFTENVFFSLFIFSGHSFDIILVSNKKIPVFGISNL